MFALRFLNRFLRKATGKPASKRHTRRRPLHLEALEDRLCLSLTLTQAGNDAGIVLSTFAVGFPSFFGNGPNGIAFPSGGGVLVTDYPGNVRLFPTDTDGQTTNSHPPRQSYGRGNAVGLAQVGDAIYVTSQQSSRQGVYQLNPDGTFNQFIVGVPHATGIVANPANGHLFVSSFDSPRIIDVDPLAKKSTLFLNPGGHLDGLTISADGSILYAARTSDGRILGIDTKTRQIVFTSQVIPGGPDGVAAGIGPLAGELFVNTNRGTVWEVDSSDPTMQTMIADHGSRGDFVTFDPNDGSALFTQTDLIVRMTFPFGAAHRLTLGGFPTAINAGIAGNFRVTALDESGLPVTDYTGTVHFTSRDSQAKLPADYTFTAADHGAHTFAATFTTTGSQTITVTDTTDPRLKDTQSNITVIAASQALTKPLFAVGGAPGRVQVRHVSDNSLVADFTPFGSSFTGGVSVAIGDVDGDGYPDLVVGATVGNPQIKVYNGKALADGSFNSSNPDASLLTSFFAFGLNFNVGANVAVGDINRDGFADIVAGATVGNPQVKVYDGQAIAHHTFNSANPDASLLTSFFAYGLQFNIGANVAVGDVNHDGFADIVTGATAGNPQVKVYDGQAIAHQTFKSDNPEASVLASFFAFGLQFNVGAFVAVGDVNGDGFGDVITGATVGNPDVHVYSGQAIAYGQFTTGHPEASLLDQFFAYDLQFNVGAAVAAADFEGLGKTDILTGASQGTPHYRVVRGIATGVKPPAVFESIPAGLQGGIAVGA